MRQKQDSSQEFQKFDQTMKTILSADPKAVKQAMEAEKRAREEEAKRTGKRGRGRPPKHRSAKGTQ